MPWLSQIRDDVYLMTYYSFLMSYYSFFVSTRQGLTGLFTGPKMSSQYQSYFKRKGDKDRQITAMSALLSPLPSICHLLSFIHLNAHFEIPTSTTE